MVSFLWRFQWYFFLPVEMTSCSCLFSILEYPNFVLASYFLGDVFTMFSLSDFIFLGSSLPVVPFPRSSPVLSLKLLAWVSA